MENIHLIFWKKYCIKIQVIFKSQKHLLQHKNLKEKQCYIKEHGRHAAIQMNVWKSKFYAAHDIIINVDHIIEIEYNNKALI